MTRYCPRSYEPVVVTRQLAAPVAAEAIDVALRLAERGIRCKGEPDEWCEVSSDDYLRSVQFRAMAGGAVAVRHIVARWLVGGTRVARCLARYGTARDTILEAGDPRAVRALAVMRALPVYVGPDSHGS